MKIKGFAATEAGAQLVPFEYKSQPLGSQEVLVRVSHCGICHSDIHLIRNDWRSSTFPVVAGHEVVGEVLQLGAEVDWLTKGQRVGIGWQSGSCMQCEWCISGQENLCKSSEGTAVGRHGGFGDHIVSDARFAFPIPATLSSENAAPLLCGGITVYSPLRRFEVRHWHKVAVVGIGGLGHLAIQFAAAMGCEVTAISSSPSKENEAKQLGAKHFVAGKEDPKLKACKESFDFILVAATADLDWKPYVNALRPNGRMCFVTAEATNLDIPAGMLLGGQKSISGSIIGGRAMMQEMLDFAALHGIEAKTELFPMKDVNVAIDKLDKNEMRYRAVLKI